MHCNHAATFDDRCIDISAMILKDARLLHAAEEQSAEDIMYALHAGGNIDDRRIGIGASMYYPVAVEGALVSMGDAHSAQGDSEFDGKPRPSATFISHLSSVLAECLRKCLHKCQTRQDKQDIFQSVLTR